MKLDSGQYKLGEKCHAVIFHTSNDVKDVKEFQHRLEIDCYPSPGSLRLSAFGKGLTDFGIERGRLPQMYKVGKDTSATYLLLMHGASRLSLDAYGACELPSWCPSGELRDVLLLDLLDKARRGSPTRMLNDAEIDIFKRRVLLELRGGIISCNPCSKRYMKPLPSSSLHWSNVEYRLTLGWSEPATAAPAVGSSAASSSDAIGGSYLPVQPLHNYALTLERFEVSGDASSESATKPIVEDVQVLMVLFFGSAPTYTDVPVDAREDLLYINVDGDAARRTTLSLGFGERFGDRDLGELSRRTGIPLTTFREALGALSQYI